MALIYTINNCFGAHKNQKKKKVESYFETKHYDVYLSF